MSRRIRHRVGRHTQTAFIELERSRCQACWKCVEACPNGVLGKIRFFGHRHAHVSHAEACKGCKRCVRACPNKAIRYTYVPPQRRAPAAPAGLIQQDGKLSEFRISGELPG